MIPKHLDGRAIKPTPTCFAKALILSLGERAFYWSEERDFGAITEKEADKIDAAVRKHFARIERFLGLD